MYQARSVKLVPWMFEVIRARWRVWLEVGLPVVGFASAFVVVLAYVAAFGGYPFGGPVEWALFADYLGGFLNPIIGLVTVILVVLTLRTTRLEASRTQQQMREQVNILKKDQILRDMQKRLDGVLSEWNRTIDLVADSRVQASQEAFAIKKTCREILEDRQQAYLLGKLDSVMPGMQEHSVPNWKEVFDYQASLIRELDRYCTEYEQASGTQHLTVYYKTRVFPAARTLHAANILETTVYHRIRGDWR